MSQDPVATDALTELGLSASPFTPSDYASADFISPLRENQVQRAAHLCRYGDQLLVVVGDKGTGKTFFLTKLAQDLSDVATLAVVDAASYRADSEAFWNNLVAQLMGAAAAGVGIGAQIAALRQFLAQSAEPPVLLVDNADAFDDQALAILLSLMSTGMAESPIKTVLVGNKTLVERLDGLNNIDVMIYDLELAIVTVEQWQKFCDIQLRLHGLSGANPITEESLQFIINDAGINVRKVFERLDDKLRETKVTALPKKGNLGLPPIHIALITGLVAVLLLVVLLGERLLGGDPAPEVPAYNKDTEVVVFDPVAEEAELARLRAAELAADAAAPADTGAVQLGVPVVASAGSIGERPVAQVQPKPAVKTEPKPVIKPEPVVKPEPAVKPEPKAVVKVEPKPVVEPAPKPAVKPEPKPAVVNAPPKAPASGGFDVPDGRYVLQIMASSDRRALAEFYAQQSNKSSLRIANIDRSGQSWYVLVQGSYASPEAARAAIGGLPASQRRDGIWPRSSESIKQILLKDR